MSAPQKASDEALLEAYARLGSCYKVGSEFGMRASSAHERLVKLGAVNPVNVFTDAERDRLTREYAIYRAHGKVAELAAEMGRTVPFLSRKAGELGIATHDYERLYAGKWKYMSESAARILFDDFKASPLTLGEWCAKKGIDDEGFRTTMSGYWPDEWEPVIESKAPASTKYRLGRAVEYRVRDVLKEAGYFAMRSPASKTPIDVVAIKPGQVLLIQCKRSGALPPGEWNELYDLALSCGAIPVMAERPYPRTLNFWRLTARKDGSRRRQPMEPFAIDEIEAADE